MLVARVKLTELSSNRPKMGFSVKGKGEAPYMEGECRMTVFDATSNARFFDYRSGDGRLCAPHPRLPYSERGHYHGPAPQRFNLSVFQDISLNQWMAL